MAMVAIEFKKNLFYSLNLYTINEESKKMNRNCNEHCTLLYSVKSRNFNLPAQLAAPQHFKINKFFTTHLNFCRTDFCKMNLI